MVVSQSYNCWGYPYLCTYHHITRGGRPQIVVSLVVTTPNPLGPYVVLFHYNFQVHGFGSTPPVLWLPAAVGYTDSATLISIAVHKKAPEFCV